MFFMKGTDIFIAPRHQKQGRMFFLDGLRGIAILAVILFHCYTRWPGMVPYGARFSHFPLFSFGFLGVQLFFLISGYVIFMTLEKSKNFPDFITRRWLRLFPAMLVCGAMLYFSADLFPERPRGDVSATDLIPGLLFIDPLWIEALTGKHQGLIEGTFWTLFAEVKFYFIAGILYFSIGQQKTIFVLITLFFATIAVLGLQKEGILAHDEILAIIARESGAEHFGWFSGGALYFSHAQRDKKTLPYKAILVGLISSVITGGFDVHTTIMAALVVVLFTLAMRNKPVRFILSSRVILFFGTISYPLYLLHENMMIAIIIKLGIIVPWLPQILLPILPIAFVIVLAFIVQKFLEPQAREAIRPPYDLARRFLGIEKTHRAAA